MVEKFDCFRIEYAIVAVLPEQVEVSFLFALSSSSLEIRKHVFELPVHLNFRHYRDDMVAKENN